eukprot:TRINITY_DN6189_c0_g1_i1.p1 TRINITY_DN6189_c0_g1~~TRINITY_DN6189_c0_g1_i1.p1  ORF type:complete len:903 (+),score=78.50 TRINITY_DN6189_c0_g1_i1:1784-4492(+)
MFLGTFQTRNDMIDLWDVYDLPTDELVVSKSQIEESLSESPEDGRLLELLKVVSREIQERGAADAILERLNRKETVLQYEQKPVLEPEPEPEPLERRSSSLPQLGSVNKAVYATKESPPVLFGMQRHRAFEVTHDIIYGCSLEKNEFNTNKIKKVVKTKSSTPIPTSSKKIVPLPRPSSVTSHPIGTKVHDPSRTLRRRSCKSAVAAATMLAAFCTCLSNVDELNLVVTVVCSSISCVVLRQRAINNASASILTIAAASSASTATSRVRVFRASAAAVSSALSTAIFQCRALQDRAVKACMCSGAIVILSMSRMQVIERKAGQMERLRHEREAQTVQSASSPSTPTPAPAPKIVNTQLVNQELVPRKAKEPTYNYSKYFPSFSSLWIPFEKHGKVDSIQKDERQLLEMACREILNWAQGVLDDNQTQDESDEETSYPNKGKQGKETQKTCSELSGVLCELLESKHTREKLQEAGERMEYFTQKSRDEVYQLVQYTLENVNGWSECTRKSFFNYMWMWRKPRISCKYLFALQRVNHYPGSFVLTRKDCLKKCLQRFRRLPGKAGESFNIFPETFALPQDSTQFIESTGLTLDRIRLQQLASGTKGHHSDSCGVWITKPVGMSRGRGIEIVTHPASIEYSEALVIQRYIQNPLLVHGYKFDMRLYVVVSSFQPLEAYLSTLGFARFTSLPFTMDPASFGNRLVHLTNTSVQSNCVPPPFCSAENMCKWGLDQLAEALPELTGQPWEKTWAKVTECLVKCLAAADVSVTNHNCCFELLGFDVLLDDKCEPWVLEVNASPSLEIDTPLDERVKTRLMKDCFHLINPQPYNKFHLMEVLSRRLSGQLASKKSVSTRHSAPARDVLNEDISKILGNVPPQTATQPESTHFERLAPSSLYDRICRMMRL